jgi:hypothetical protein
VSLTSPNSISYEIIFSKIDRILFFYLDARFNKALIDNCQNDISKYCQNAVLNDDDGEDDDDDDDDNDTGK